MTAAQGPRGTYRPCPVCAAPIINPFPESWEIEVVKEGPPRGPVKSFITPHRDGCTAPYADPQPGIALRLPGGNVASLRFDLPPVSASALRRAFNGGELTTCGVDLDDGWTFVGHTDGSGITTADAVGPIRAGEAVVYAGPGHLFVKPVVPYDLDAGLPIIDAIVDAADGRDAT